MKEEKLQGFDVEKKNQKNSFFQRKEFKEKKANWRKRLLPKIIRKRRQPALKISSFPLRQKEPIKNKTTTTSPHNTHTSLQKPYITPPRMIVARLTSLSPNR